MVGDARADLAGLAAALRHDDVEVLTAAGAGSALEVLARAEIAAAVLDLERPDDRYRTAEALRACDGARALPLLFVVAGPHDPRVAFHGHASGPVEFLSRSLAPGALARTLGALLAGCAGGPRAAAPLRPATTPPQSAPRGWARRFRAHVARRSRA